MKRNLALLLFSLIYCSACQKSTNIEVVGPEEFLQLIQDTSHVRLLDVRTQQEFNEGHLPAAFLFDVKDSLFMDKVTESFDSSKKIAVYCRSGRRSKLAADQLVEMGYTVIELDSGFVKWNKEGFPVVKD